MDDYKPFLSESFRKFVLELKDQGAKVCCAVKYPNGSINTVGDPDIGIDSKLSYIFVNGDIVRFVILSQWQVVF